jgi:hypothetical protein
MMNKKQMNPNGVIPESDECALSESLFRRNKKQKGPMFSHQPFFLFSKRGALVSEF